MYRLSSTGAWDRVATGGFGDASNVGIDRLTEFNGQLYASTWVEDGSGAQIWRSSIRQRRLVEPGGARWIGQYQQH